MVKAEKTRQRIALITLGLGTTGALIFTGCSAETQPQQNTTTYSAPAPTYAEDSMEQFIQVAQKATEPPTPPPSPSPTGISPSAPQPATPTPISIPTNPEEVGNTSFNIPQQWSPTTAPGSEKAFLITTAPQQRAVSFSTVSGGENVIDTDFLRKVSTGLTGDTQKNITQIQTAVITPSEGLILFTHNNTVYHSWVISNLTGTYLVSLGPPYNEGKSGSVAPPVPASSASPAETQGSPAPADSTSRPTGTALEQTQTIVDEWLGI